MDKLSEYCDTLKKCCCVKKDSSSIDLNTTISKSQVQINNKQTNFVCKTLLMKLCQFLIIAGYFFFVLQLSSSFKGVSLWWIIIPACCYLFISAFVRIKKTPPHFSVMLIMHMLISFCFSFIIGVVFTKFELSVMFLPLSVLFVYVAYLILIPLFFTQKILIDMNSWKYYLIPFTIVLIMNIILLGILTSLPPYKLDDKMRMFRIYSLPTMLLSNILTFISMLQIRQIIAGKWFHVMYDALFYDYLYAALYLF